MTASKPVKMGYILVNKQGEEALLPMTDVPDELKEGDEIKVFIYKNSQEDIVATTKKPHIILNEFAYLEVKSNTEHGAFLDWGLDKDLFVPFSEQISKLKEGNWYLVYLYYDKKSDRLAATTKTNKFIEREKVELKTGQEVDILIAEKKELGYSVIINNRYIGMIYNNEIFRVINPGDKMKAFVRAVREDGKVDVTLQQLGYKNIEPDAQRILDKLTENSGVLYLTDNSSPDDIQFSLQMSKKAFKRAIGSLYKHKVVEIKEDGIYLK